MNNLEKAKIAFAKLDYQGPFQHVQTYPIPSDFWKDVNFEVDVPNRNTMDVSAEYIKMVMLSQAEFDRTKPKKYPFLLGDDTGI